MEYSMSSRHKMPSERHEMLFPASSEEVPDLLAVSNIWSGMDNEEQQAQTCSRLGPSDMGGLNPFIAYTDEEYVTFGTNMLAQVVKRVNDTIIKTGRDTWKMRSSGGFDHMGKNHMLKSVRAAMRVMLAMEHFTQWVRLADEDLAYLNSLRSGMESFFGISLDAHSTIFLAENDDDALYEAATSVYHMEPMTSEMTRGLNKFQVLEMFCGEYVEPLMNACLACSTSIWEWQSDASAPKMFLSPVGDVIKLRELTPEFLQEIMCRIQVLAARCLHSQCEVYFPELYVTESLQYLDEGRISKMFQPDQNVSYELQEEEENPWESPDLSSTSHMTLTRESGFGTRMMDGRELESHGPEYRIPVSLGDSRNVWVDDSLHMSRALGGEIFGDFVLDEDFDPSMEALDALFENAESRVQWLEPPERIELLAKREKYVQSLPRFHVCEWTPDLSSFPHIREAAKVGAPPPDWIPLHDGRCAICLEDYEADEFVKLLPCFHAFHEDCISVWITNKRLCPQCRMDVFSCRP